MEKVKDFLERHSPDRKKLKEIKVKQIDDKVREIDCQINFECASLASSSSSGWAEDETLSSQLNGGEQKQTVLGQCIIGRGKIINWKSIVKNRYGNVQFTKNKYYYPSGNILSPSKLSGETTTRRIMEKIWGSTIDDVKNSGVYGMGEYFEQCDYAALADSGEPSPSPSLQPFRQTFRQRQRLDRKILDKIHELEELLDGRRDEIGEVEQIDKVREINRIKFLCIALWRNLEGICDEDETSKPSSSNSEWPEPKQTVLGIGGIGATYISNSNASITYTYGNVQITETNYR